jgi:high-affinity iron transporter
MLLYVGFWLHSKSAGQRWSAFIKSQVSGALGRGTLWGLAAISFLAVYREVFETVLFYQALIAQGGATAVLSGFVTGCAVLVALALLIVRFSAKLPLGVFFGASSILLALMAVVFAGQGVAALQAAGKLPSDPVAFPSFPVLGIYPNLQGLVLQLVLLVIIVGTYVHTSRSSARSA